jgi:tyrosine-specific transport protein
MQKQIGSALIIAGTCIGSGMIALPMVLAKLGVLPSLVIMFLTWGLSYYTALVSVELNLHADRGLAIGALGKKFSGKRAELIGTFSVKLLSYALLSAYISGASSVVKSLIETYFNSSYSVIHISACLAVITLLTLLAPIKIIDRINRVMFMIMIAIFLILLSAIVISIDCSKISMVTEPSSKNIASVISVVFTSFGFQVIFHTLRDYCGKDVKALKRAFLFGTLIPLVIYSLWTCGVLSILYNFSDTLYEKMVLGEMDVGGLIKALSNISGLPSLQVLIWWISIFAILTSILGVGIGLADSLNSMLSNNKLSSGERKFLSSLLTVIPAYFVASVIPDAFINVLGFAGIIVVIIAILLPIYLLYKADLKKLYCTELRHKWLLVLSVIAGIGIMVVEILS